MTVGNTYVTNAIKKLKKQKIPCQAVCNKLQLFEFPNEISCLRKLEKVIISKRLLFKKIVIMPKGQAPKLKGAICNVPLQADNVCNILPRGADSNGIVMVKLKRKLMYRGHVYFEAVRPDVVNPSCPGLFWSYETPGGGGHIVPPCINPDRNMLLI